MSDDFVDAIEDMPRNLRGAGVTPTSGSRKPTLEDFYAVAPENKCLHRPTHQLWSNAAVDDRVDPVPRLDKQGQPVLHKTTGEPLMNPASLELARTRSVHGLAWLPGEGEIIHDRVVIDGKWMPQPGVALYNTYVPPADIPGDATQAKRWVDHVHALFTGEGEAEHFIAWLAHRIQHPEIKVNHGILMIGVPGIGKDTLLVPLREGVGAGNFKEVTLNQMMGSFNDYLVAVVLRINEARDSGDAGKGRIDRYAMHDHLKPVLAEPPETHRINRKYMQEFYAANVVGAVITTNHPEALFLPEDDRRLLVLRSPCRAGAFSKEFFDGFYRWYAAEGGIGHVIAFLKERDLAAFNAKAPPPKTAGFYNIVAADCDEETGELLGAIDALGREVRDKAARSQDAPFERPEALTVGDLIGKAPGADWLTDRRQSRAVPHRLRRCGYERVLNPDAKGNYGMWFIGGKHVAIYARADLMLSERLEAARRRHQFGPVNDRKGNFSEAKDSTQRQAPPR